MQSLFRISCLASCTEKNHINYNNYSITSTPLVGVCRNVPSGTEEHGRLLNSLGPCSDWRVAAALPVPVSTYKIGDKTFWGVRSHAACKAPRAAEQTAQSDDEE